MLSGDNSTLQKATYAKEKTERQSVIEQAKIDVLGRQAENNGKSLSKADLQGVLEKYFDGVPDLTTSEMTNETIKSKELNTKSEYGNYTIQIGEIYNGSFEEAVTDLKRLQNYFIGQMVSSFYNFNEKSYVHREGENMPDETKIHDCFGTEAPEYMVIEYDGKYYEVYIQRIVVDESLPEDDFNRYDTRVTDVKETYSYKISQGINSYIFFLINRQSETVSINPTYLPKMIVEGEEIDLTPAIYYDGSSINLHYDSSISDLIGTKYNGKNAIITMTINGEEVKWEGVIRFTVQ